jgi:hypothetical protein
MTKERPVFHQIDPLAHTRYTAELVVSQKNYKMAALSSSRDLIPRHGIDLLFYMTFV